MNKSTELRETRATLTAQARQIYNDAKSGSRSLSDDEKGQIESLFTQIDNIATELTDVERAERLDLVEAELRSSAGRKLNPRTETIVKRERTDEDKAAAFRAWCLAPSGQYSADDHVKAAECGIALTNRSISVRALSKGTTTAGGFSVPQDFADTYERKLAYYFPVKDAISSFNTGDGRDLPYPQVDDTSNLAAIVSEAGNLAGSTADPSMTQVTFKAWKYARQVVKVSTELLQDSMINVPAMLGELFAESFGRAYDAAVVSSNAGSAAPEGLLHSVSASVNLATGNAMTLAKLIALEVSVDIAYRRSPGCGFLMHDATWGAIRQLATSTGAPVFQIDLQQGVAPRLLGYPVYISNNLTSISAATDNEPLILFGALDRYKWRQVTDRSLVRLDELYAANGQIGFTMLERVDGRYVGHSGCVKTLNAFDAP